MSLEASESVTALRHLIRTARAHGLVLEEGPTAREPAFSSRVSPAHAHALWAEAARALGPSLPLLVAASADDGPPSLLYFAATACRTIGEVLQLVIAHWRYVTDAFALELALGPDELQLSLQLAAPGEQPLGARLAVEYLVAQLARGGARLSGGAWRPQAIVLGHRPPLDAARWEAACGAPLRIVPGASPGLVFSPASLAIPVAGGVSPAAGRCFGELLAWYAPRPRLAGGTAERVTRALARNLSGVAPTVEQVAVELAVSPRSLHRQLAAEGTSYQRLLDGLRCDEAIRQALEDQRPFKAIATAVGFADSRAFRRAFKRWTGVTPQAFRLRHTGSPRPTGNDSAAPRATL